MKNNINYQNLKKEIHNVLIMQELEGSIYDAYVLFDEKDCSFRSGIYIADLEEIGKSYTEYLILKINNSGYDSRWSDELPIWKEYYITENGISTEDFEDTNEDFVNWYMNADIVLDTVEQLFEEACENLDRRIMKSLEEYFSYENELFNAECFSLGLNELLDTEEFSDYSFEIYAYYYLSDHSVLIDEEEWHIFADNAYEAKKQLAKGFGYSSYSQPLYDVKIMNGYIQAKIIIEDINEYTAEDIEYYGNECGNIVIYVDNKLKLY